MPITNVLLENLKKQPIMNIGCLGSVSHGKSTMVKLLTGKSTQQHSKEKIKNITMKVGYANTKIYENNNNYTLEESENLVHHFSFVDCPGHHELIEVMMSGANLMNYGIVVVAGNQSIKLQPQLKQHLLTAKLTGIKKLIFILNKLDLITKTLALERKYELEEYLKSLGIENPIIIPMALNLGLNQKYLLDAIMNEFPPILTKNQNLNSFIFSISRSFDINRNGINPLNMKGGVVGGSVIDGNLKLNDNIIISPGQIKFDKSKNEWRNKPFTSKVVSLKSETDNLSDITCGGLTAVGLEIDPFFTQSDRLKGQILHSKNIKINCVSEIICDIVTLDDFTFNKNQILTLQVGCSTIQGKITNIKKTTVTFNLNKLIPIYKDIKILISDKNNKMIDLIGVGNIVL